MVDELTNEPAWRNLWRLLGVAPPAAHYFQELQTLYREPQRAYHTLAHIEECLAHLATVAPLAQNLATVTAALWFHDVIYEPRRTDNEEASAQWAAALLRSVHLPPETIDQVTVLIADTAHRRPPHTADGALLVDIDLAILGAPPARFAAYEEQIRHEYQWVPWPTYCQRRTAVLAGFLASATIYHSPHFQQNFEAQARKNLIDSIAQLRVAAAH